MPRRVITRVLCALALLAAPTLAQAQLCGDTARPTADGRLLGHFPYGDVADGDLVQAPPGFALGQGCMIRKEVLPDLARLIAAADGDPATHGRLRGLSCHRSIAMQGSVFCKPRADADAATRAISVAPPGHSEHTSGYAIDFAIRPANGCPDAEACMAATPMAAWLLANAPKYGFELSFPGGNKQNVKWEPWHWRWVGVSANAPGAGRARFIFARARRAFPADPAVDGPTVIRFVPRPPTFINLPAYRRCDTRKNRKKYACPK